MRSIEATIVLLIFVFPASVFAQNSLDGYFWEKADVFKPMILTSFLGGYYQGRLQGTVESAEEVSNAVPKYEKEEEGTEGLRIKRLALFALFEATRKAFHKDLLKDTAHNIEFYRKEVDAFYQSFPLCKRRNIFSLLGDLINVWESRRSYKEIGNQCLESPNK